MAETWIKMRTNLMTHPKVVHISVTLQAHCSVVCGACYALWSIADAHSIDGKLPGYTYAVIDSLVGLPGFCAAAEKVQWVRQDDNGVILPRFGSHNGETGKARALAARRASRQRAKATPNGVTPASRERHAPSVTKGAPTADKREIRTAAAAAEAPKPAAPAAGFSDEEFRARAAYLLRKPEWLPEGKPWIDEEAARELAALPRLTQPLVDRVIRTARDGRKTLDNPAGLVVKRLRALGGPA